MSIEKHIREILTEYQEKLGDVLGDRLESVVLYGSQARGMRRMNPTLMCCAS